MLVFTFPGQGSQRPGMGRPWLDHPSWEVVEEASASSGLPLGHLLLEAESEELKDTRNAQPALYVMCLTVLDAVERIGLDPSFCAGHSLGEYTALTAAGALSIEDGVALVTERAEAMHDAGLDRPGTMAAVLGLDDDQVEVACRRADDDVWVANFNAPGQVVIAGAHAGVATASNVARELGAKKVMPLQVAGAFHTSFMGPARDRVRKAVASAILRDADVPIVANVDAMAHDRGDDWSSLLSAQLTSPVRWKHGLLTLAASGVTDYVEIGPGGVLTATAKRTVETARTLSVATPEDLDRLLDFIDLSGVQSPALHEGEHQFATERLVSSPGSGVFTSQRGLVEGSMIEVGQLVGMVDQIEVRSPFAGRLESFVAVDGERVSPRQPIAWMRTP